jgi:hypothetical protein
LKLQRPMLAISILSLGFLAGCATSPSSGAVADANGAAAAVDGPSLQPGMPYAQVADRLQSQGWLPLEDRTACIANLGARAEACKRMPELFDCPRAEACSVQYANAGMSKILRLDIATVSPSNRDGVVLSALKSWTTSNLAISPAATSACPAEDFDAFLRAFASDPQLRTRFTAPLVKAARIVDRGDVGDAQIDVWVEAAKYRDFILRYAGGEFRLQPDAPVKLRVEPAPGGAYDVAIAGDVEGYSYRFAKYGDCWRLAEDPEAVP